MAKYLFEGTYTAEGAKGVQKEGGTARKRAVEQVAGSVGGKVEAFYFTFGERDYVIIAELPDNAAAVALSVAVSASGATHPRTTQLMAPEEFDAVAKKQASYRAPGH